MGEQDAILVVDADPEAALLLSDFLEREGYSVAAAATGGEGLRLVRQERFALVLLDLQLPDDDSTPEPTLCATPPSSFRPSARNPTPDRSPSALSL